MDSVSSTGCEAELNRLPWPVHSRPGSGLLHYTRSLTAVSGYSEDFPKNIRETVQSIPKFPNLSAVWVPVVRIFATVPTLSGLQVRLRGRLSGDGIKVWVDSGRGGMRSR